MEKSTKNILIFLGITGVIVMSYFAYQKYSKSSDITLDDGTKVDAKKKKQFDDIINAFSKGNKDVFASITPEMYSKSLANFSKNVTDDDTDFMMGVSSKKQSDMTPAEQLRLVTILSKLLSKK
jgi:hypothetical protein